MYSKLKAEKLTKEFDYLKTKSYFPFGIEGREFKITLIETTLDELVFDHIMLHVNKYKNPNYKQETLENHQNGNNWKVILTISHSDDIIKVELEEVLKVLKIRHDIAKSFN
jgi:CO dehydrogenase nickel-insertion accessory protein CooC1